MSSSEDYLPLSGIQHFVFCRRQWVLIHVEQLWQENLLTAEGRASHQRVHGEEHSEKRGGLLITRGLRVFSDRLKLQGVCDVVEFRKSPGGVPLQGREGLWQPFPVEYKHGSAGQSTLADSMQLCCQALCLEEMLCCDIEQGALFYQTTHRREPVVFDQNLRNQAMQAAREMNELFTRGHTPKVKPKPACKSCSLRDLCLPQLLQGSSVTQYVSQAIQEARPNEETAEHPVHPQ